MSDPVRGVDYGECPLCYHQWVGDSVECPGTGERCHRECHAECDVCAEETFEDRFWRRADERYQAAKEG